ncbi:MAG: PEP-CTERM sorting domain-containing protein [Verrucomicrobiota bacterium]
MKNLRVLSSALTALAVLSSANFAQATNEPADWQECYAIKATLGAWDFENLSTGQLVPSIAPSYVHPDVIATDIYGPSSPMTVDQGGSQWGAFSGFPSDGDQGTINFDLLYTGDSMVKLSGFTFDVYSGGDAAGLHGPTNLFVNVLVNGGHVWQSELIELTPGAGNQFHWDISNPDGNNFNFDGDTLVGNDFSWMQLTSGDSLAFQIVAAGANSSTESLYLDNVSVLACVPEPSGALLLMAAGMVLVFRMRRSRFVIL